MGIPLTLGTAAPPLSANASPIEVANSAMRRLDILNHPDDLLEGLAAMNVVWAAIFLVVGLLCVFNGYRWHRRVVFVCAFLTGLGVGKYVGHQMNDSRIVMGALGLLFAIVSVPMMRFAVAIFGGLTGAFIGANAWTAFSESPDSHLAGAAMGFIAMALLSFIAFKPVVITFTAIGGGALAVMGGITLLLNVPSWDQPVRDALSDHQMLIPLLVTVSACIGFVLQQTEFGLVEHHEPAPA